MEGLTFTDAPIAQSADVSKHTCVGIIWQSPISTYPASTNVSTSFFWEVQIRSKLQPITNHAVLVTEGYRNINAPICNSSTNYHKLFSMLLECFTDDTFHWNIYYIFIVQYYYSTCKKNRIKIPHPLKNCTNSALIKH